jgi:hypothetical protein
MVPSITFGIPTFFNELNVNGVDIIDTLNYPKRETDTTWSNRLIHIDVFTLIISCEKCNLCPSSWCALLQTPMTSSAFSSKQILTYIINTSHKHDIHRTKEKGAYFAGVAIIYCRIKTLYSISLLVNNTNQMPRSTLPNLLTKYAPRRIRYQGRPLKRLLDEWDRNRPAMDYFPGGKIMMITPCTYSN